MRSSLATSASFSPPVAPEVDEASYPATIRLDARGFIGECSAAVERLLGYSPRELVGAHISRLLRYFAATPLVVGGQLDSRVAYLSRCGFGFDVSRRDGGTIAAELYFSAPTGNWTQGVNLILRRKEPASKSPGARPV